MIEYKVGDFVEKEYTTGQITIGKIVEMFDRTKTDIRLGKWYFQVKVLYSTRVIKGIAYLNSEYYCRRLIKLNKKQVIERLFLEEL